MEKRIDGGELNKDGWQVVISEQLIPETTDRSQNNSESFSEPDGSEWEKCVEDRNTTTEKRRCVFDRDNGATLEKREDADPIDEDENEGKIQLENEILEVFSNDYWHKLKKDTIASAAYLRSYYVYNEGTQAFSKEMDRIIKVLANDEEVTFDEFQFYVTTKLLLGFPDPKYSDMEDTANILLNLRELKFIDPLYWTNFIIWERETVTFWPKIIENFGIRGILDPSTTVDHPFNIHANSDEDWKGLPIALSWLPAPFLVNNQNK